MVVVDDASTDDSVEVANRLAESEFLGITMDQQERVVEALRRAVQES